ncbi:MAG: PrgI family protein [Candidatus Pacebacteria bacterium]|nr:PrgI family protein [Candidatus Paceibacterota bacterium]
MQFKVPQFIDIEDKLFGPLTFRQFAYLAGGGGMVFVIYKLLPLWIGIFLMLPIVILVLALAFYKINNQPFIYYLQASITYAITNKLYVWKQRLVKPSLKKEEPEKEQTINLPRMSGNKLSDLAWSLDVETKDTSNTNIQ